MSDELSKKHARQVFEAGGFCVEDIPKSQVKGELRADLKVCRNKETYIVEAKGKEATDEFICLISEARKMGVASVTREL